MQNNNTSKTLAVFITIAGAMVMMGWFFDIHVLKNILPTWVTMKFSTALCFFLSGVSLYFIAKTLEKNSGIAQVILPATTLTIVIFMGSFFISILLGIYLGIEELFIKESAQAVASIVPGRPSLPTVINFILIAAASFLVMLDVQHLKPRLTMLGWIILIIGGLATIGYMLKIPLLYYYIQGINTAMALHTSILFVLAGLSLIISKNNN